MPAFDPGFSTPEMTAVFSPRSRVDHMLKVEAALARIEGALGIVPGEIASQIEAACDKATVDPGALATTGWEEGTPVLPLLDAVRVHLSPEAAGWLHHGATTQDIVDSAMGLQMRSGLRALSEALDRSVGHLESLADTHRHTPLTGRTFLLPAAATTFGVVLAAWMQPLERHRRRLEAKSREIPLQMGGPVGDMQAFGSAAGKVLERLADELGLAVPVLPWHTDRTPISDAINALEAICRTVSKIADDIALLVQFGEVRVRSGRSSSMPAKANPIDAIRAVAASSACLGASSVVTRGPSQELQRGIGGWHAEWWAVPMTFQCGAAAVASLERCLATLEPDTATMARNLTAANLDPPDPASAGVLIDRVIADRARQLGAS